MATCFCIGTDKPGCCINKAMKYPFWFPPRMNPPAGNDDELQALRRRVERLEKLMRSVVIDKSDDI